MLLGRSVECDVQMDSLKHKTMVSRMHCRIGAKRGAPEAWTIEDLGSANGTAVNGQRLEASKRVRVVAGDVVTIGRRGISEARYRVEAHSC